MSYGLDVIPDMREVKKQTAKIKKRAAEEKGKRRKKHKEKDEAFLVLTVALLFILKQETRMASTPTGFVRRPLGLARPPAVWQ